MRRKALTDVGGGNANRDGEGGLRPTLGAGQLVLLGVGGTIGTGIFVLTSAAAQKAGPGMLVSFVLAGIVCGLAALCYAELAAMVPRAGSAYTYSYVAVGELPAWLVGWALVLEYAVTAAAVAVGWSGYLVGELQGWFGVRVPAALTSGPSAGGVVNLPATLLVVAVAGLLLVGTRESARANAVLVVVKLAALSMFAALALPSMRGANFTPFAPRGWAGGGGAGVLGAAASVFFAYVGFDAVSTAAEETRNPQRDVPLGLIGGLAIVALAYVVVAAGVVGSPLGAQPVLAPGGSWLPPGSPALTRLCARLDPSSWPLPCSSDGLAHVMRVMHHPLAANLIGLAAFLALPSVVLVMIYGQTRMFLAMARDGLIPQNLAAVHPRSGTPRLLTAGTAVAIAAIAGFLPIGRLADIANAGTLFAFSMVSFAVLRLRRSEPDAERPFRVPAAAVVAPTAIAGCVGFFASLPLAAELVLPGWAAVGLLVYCLYGRRRSRLADGRRGWDCDGAGVLGPEAPTPSRLRPGDPG